MTQTRLNWCDDVQVILMGEGIFKIIKLLCEDSYFFIEANRAPQWGGWGYPWSSPIPCPVTVLFKCIIRNESVTFNVRPSWFDKFVRLLPVATPVGQLKIADVSRVTALSHRDDMVNGGG